MSVRAVHTWTCDRCEASAPPSHLDERPDDWHSLAGNDVCGSCWASFESWWLDYRPPIDAPVGAVHAFFMRVGSRAEARTEET